MVWPEVPAATPAADKDEEGEYEEAGQRKTTKLPDPLAPTAAERAERELTHTYHTGVGVLVVLKVEADKRTTGFQNPKERSMNYILICFHGRRGRGRQIDDFGIEGDENQHVNGDGRSEQVHWAICSHEMQNIFGKTWSRVCRRDC